MTDFVNGIGRQFCGVSLPTDTPHYAFQGVQHDENCDRKLLKNFATYDLKAVFLDTGIYILEDGGICGVFSDKTGRNSLKGVNFQNDYISRKWLIVSVTHFYST